MNKATQKTFFKKAIFLFLTIFFSYSYAQITVSDSGPGNYTFLVPCDVTSITIEAWGAGGAGGGGTSNNDGGQGGGAGAYATSTTAVTGGQEITYTVGARGTGSTGNGGNGGNTTVSLGTLVLNGGNGGIQNGTSNPANGGTGTGTGWTITTGNDGANGGGNTAGDGADAATFAGSGGNGAKNGNGGNASDFGAGGGGGERGPGNNSGGLGSHGRVSITYTTAYQFYCNTFYTTGIEPITNVTFAGINNTTSNALGGSSHEVFCSPTAIVTQGTSPTITVEGNTNGNFTDHFRAFADWNQDGDFADAGETIFIGTITNSTGTDATTASVAFPVPAGATPGLTYMRVMKRYNADPTDSCSLAYTYGQTEDYLVNVQEPPCATPTAQATGLILTPVSTTINGTFTAAAPAPDSYLVVMNTTGVTPAITDTTTYTIGQALAGGNTVVDIDSDTSFSATALNPSTLYYFFVFSYNDATCTGGPLYNTASPLNGSTTTGTISYCTPVTTSDVTSRYIDDVEFIGTLNDVSNFGTGSSAAPAGYQDYTGLVKRNTATRRRNECLCRW